MPSVKLRISPFLWSTKSTVCVREHECVILRASRLRWWREIVAAGYSWIKHQSYSRAYLFTHTCTHTESNGSCMTWWFTHFSHTYTHKERAKLTQNSTTTRRKWLCQYMQVLFSVVKVLHVEFSHSLLLSIGLCVVLAQLFWNLL